MLLSPQSCSAQPSGRKAKAWVDVDVAGGRTVIRRQHVGYPLHVTRGFYLDGARPDLLTLYLQSAAGGLYAGDRLQLDIDVSAGAALCVTTQASTVVHDGKGVGSVQQQNLNVAAGGFCALICDPYVLFPGAQLTSQTNACVADGGVLIFIDGICGHDPQERGASFVSYDSALQVTRPNGKVVLSDVGKLRGHQLRLPQGPLGDYGAAASITIIAPKSRLPDRGPLERSLTDKGCLAGASSAPHDAGLVTRILARTGGDLMRGLEAAFHVAAAAAVGAPLARRRK